MRFLVDECTGPALASWLKEHGHDVFSVYDEARGMDDRDVVQKAVAENRILLSPTTKTSASESIGKVIHTEESYFCGSKMSGLRSRLTRPDDCLPAMPTSSSTIT